MISKLLQNLHHNYLIPLHISLEEHYANSIAYSKQKSKYFHRFKASEDYHNSILSQYFVFPIFFYLSTGKPKAAGFLEGV